MILADITRHETLTPKVLQFKVIAYYIFIIRPLTVIQRDNPVYCSPAYGTFLRFGQGPIALLTGTHVTTLQKHARALTVQAYCACSRRQILLRQVELLQTFALPLPVLIQQAALFPPLLSQHVLPPQQVEQCGTGSQAKQHRQDPPDPQATLLLTQERVVVQAAEEVPQALFRGLKTNQVVVQHQLPYACHAGTQTQHFFSLLDALRTLAADEVADDVGQRLLGGVEVLIGGLQIQFSCIEWTDHSYCCGNSVIVWGEVKGHGVGALVDDLFTIIP